MDEVSLEIEDEKMIEELLVNGYKYITFREYKKSLDFNRVSGKYFINRHNTDTDIATAKEFFRIEKKHRVKTIYYFRLSALDFEFMREIEVYGSEASYYFEEIAQSAKDNYIKFKNEIKKEFIENVLMIEDKLGIKIESLYLHKDFVNRKLDIINNKITKDIKLRDELGIIYETYDKDIMENFDIYIFDKSYSQFYTPKPIFEYIDKYEKII